MLKGFLIGNVARDPSSRQVGNSMVCSFPVASNAKVGGENVATFVNVNAWGKTGEICQQYLKKGNKVALTGDLSLRSYEAKDGTQRTTLDLRVDSMELLSPPANANGERVVAKPATPSRPAPSIDIEDDDPPF